MSGLNAPAPDILMLRELCDEYLRLEEVLKAHGLSTADKQAHFNELAAVRALLRKEAKALLLGR